MAKSLSELRRMQRSQLTRINKEDLIESILATPDANEGLVQSLMERMNELVSDVKELTKAVTAPDSHINKRLHEMQAQVDKQAEILEKQQRYLEILDRKERQNNLIVTGVPDENESLDGATTEEDKLKKIWSKVGVHVEMQFHRRLGRRDDRNSRRAILVTLAGKSIRDRILETTIQLKNAGGDYNRIYIKKDVHPSIRKEWKRLYDAERAEKERPENAGCEVRLDARERKLYRDGVVIDTWNLQSF